MTVETFKIKSWEEPVSGLCIAENDEWLLVRHIPVDYVLDGYKLYQKKYIKRRKQTAFDEMRIRLFTLRSESTEVPGGFQFGDTADMLAWIEATYGLFEFQTKTEDELNYGTIETIENDDLVINMVDSHGEFDPMFEDVFSLRKIRSITFDSDYFRAIVLLMEDELG